MAFIVTEAAVVNSAERIPEFAPARSSDQHIYRLVCDWESRSNPHLAKRHRAAAVPDAAAFNSRGGSPTGFGLRPPAGAFAAAGLIRCCHTNCFDSALEALLDQ